MNLSLNTPVETAEYLRTLPAIRERCGRVHELAKEGKLEYFEYHADKEPSVAEFCAGLIKRDFGANFASIPPHGRWRHLDAGRSRVEPLIAEWKAAKPTPDTKEIAKRMIDLFLVSVLLDAGAGDRWTYKESESGWTGGRSEGLGVASVRMFTDGFFSGDATQKYKVDANGLEKITPERTAAAMQASTTNPMVGLDGRAMLLASLGSALRASPEFFGADARPGNLIDFLEKQSLPPTADAPRRVHVSALWHALIVGLAVIWPDRAQLGGIALGDVWPCPALGAVAGPLRKEGDDLVPFHKLTGWTTYSLIEPIEKVLGWQVDGVEDMTGLPEYRNGGLLVDFGVLTLKPGAIPTSFFPDPASPIPRLPPSHPAIIEWRAMTVIELDRLADQIRKVLGLAPSQLTLAQVLESATWKGGREIARQKRPATGGPPIDIESDGTVF